MKVHMLHRRCLKWLVPLLTAVWACLFLAGGFCAEMPVTLAAEQKGSVRLYLPPVKGVEMTLYPVAQHDGEKFVCCGAFEDCQAELPELSDASEVQRSAEQLASYAQDREIEGIVRQQETDGSVRFEGLEPAMYLAVQSSGMDVLNAQKILVAIPYLADETGHVSYDAKLSLKYSIPEGTAVLNKTDGDRNPVEGAHFALQKKTYISENGALPDGAETGLDVDGRFYWETVRADVTTDSHGQILLEQLVFGVYRLVETEEPEGYVLDAAPHFFTVERAGRIEEYNGIFHSIDAAVPELAVVNRREPLNGRIEITLALTDEKGESLFAEDTEFYVALFEDEERTKRVSDVLMLEFDDEFYEKVVFEHLNANHTYYIGETDRDGNLLESGSNAAGLFSVQYPGGIKAGLDEENLSVSMVIQNVFPKLPQSYYYGGVLTVTKQVLWNGKKHRSDDVYYAAVFYDADHTERCGDVIELDMKGKTERSMSVHVSVGSAAHGAMTYYVAETREDGTPLSKDAPLDFTFSVDKEEVELSAAHSKEHVTITNEFTVETEPDETDGRGVRTGDETPWEKYFIAMAVSAVLAVIFAAGRSRRKSR